MLKMATQLSFPEGQYDLQMILTVYRLYNASLSTELRSRLKQHELYLNDDDFFLLKSYFENGSTHIFDPTKNLYFEITDENIFIKNPSVGWCTFIPKSRQVSTHEES